MTPESLDEDPSPMREWIQDRLKAIRTQFAQPRFRLVLQAVVLGCLLIILGMIFLLGAQLRYEVLGSEAFRQREYEVAAQRFLRAAQLSTFFGKERNLYQVGLCYYNLKEYERSADFFQQLFREHEVPSDWHEAALAHWETIVEEMMPSEGKGPIDPSRDHTPLSRAYLEVRARHRKLVEEIRAVKGGDVSRLERFWEEYDTAWKAYNKELKDAYSAAGAQGPPNEIEAARKKLAETAPLKK